MKRLLSCLALLPAITLAEPVAVPAELQPFVLKGYAPLALAKADLDGDGRDDYLLVLDKKTAGPDAARNSEDARPLLLIRRDEGGALRLAKRNDKLVLCAGCGGVFGDPFGGIEAKRKSFTVSHYGGSNWRWSNAYTFNYSRIDRSWQLVRAEEASFHTSEPGKAKTRVYTPPRDYGKVDLHDFDPETYLKRRR
ncbi:hypothetical protein [Crenobacter cavernae]|uniref:VCBS repeat-containing protein n=1 Tax=Crenobacter cavernae TaxID=2290923 RepID=A0A345Y9B2_9NEIS|nr:hypothetical protein [Crenobacter cavernae]AXK40514.1 hypothetical protein DWG20_14340 [Crenobacter cavernae]